MCPLQSQKRSVQNEKCGRCKSREDSPLESECFPEHVPIPERPEPEHVHVIRKSGPTAEDDAGKEDEKEKETTATARPCRMRRRPVNRLWHCSTPFSLTSYSYPHNTPSASAGRLMAPSHRTVAPTLLGWWSIWSNGTPREPERKSAISRRRRWICFKPTIGQGPSANCRM